MLSYWSCWATEMIGMGVSRRWKWRWSFDIVWTGYWYSELSEWVYRTNYWVKIIKIIEYMKIDLNLDKIFQPK